MSFLEWFLAIVLFSLYLACLLTVCGLTFSKGYTVLGILGIFFPFLWLVGAILPAKSGSRFEVDQATRCRQQASGYTQ